MFGLLLSYMRGLFVYCPILLVRFTCPEVSFLCLFVVVPHPLDDLPGLLRHVVHLLGVVSHGGEAVADRDDTNDGAEDEDLSDLLTEAWLCFVGFCLRRLFRDDSGVRRYGRGRQSGGAEKASEEHHQRDEYGNEFSMFHRSYLPVLVIFGPLLTVL